MSEGGDGAATEGRFRAHVAAAALVLALAVWLSSGTLAPYASTFFAPIVSQPCAYLYNVDHPLHEASFHLLNGDPPETWSFSIVLRRILFPLVAFPFMKVAGYEVGGFVASLLCQVAGLVALAVFLRRRYGDRTALIAAWLLATYPGITYWAGQPTSYVAIVPASIGLFALLTRLDERPGARQTALTSAAMGVLFTAYDLAAFFGPAALVVLARRRRLRELPLACAGFVAAPALWLAVLKLGFHVDWSNRNTDIYGIIARAYLHPPAVGVWLRAISDLVPVLIANFVYGNLIFLPALFLLALALTRAPLRLPEGALLATGAALLLFNNLAPPYEGRWQMRGAFIPRLYQPVFVAMVVYAARAVADAWARRDPKGRVLAACAVAAFLGNASIAFGPVARVPWAGVAYQRFYLHSAEGVMEANLDRYGRRPLGFCDPSRAPH